MRLALHSARLNTVQCAHGCVARWLAARSSQVRLGQGRIGHTHGREDIQFATMARGMQRSAVSQHPDNCANRNRDTLRSSSPGKLVIKQLNGALRRRALFAPLPLHVRCKGLSETKARAHQGQEAWQVLKFVRRESLDPQNQSSQPFLRLRCTPSRCGTVGQTLQGFRGLGSGPQGLLSFRRFELFSGFPDLCKSPPRQPLSLNGKVANFCERRSW